MTYSIKVVDAEKVRVQETGEMLLSVQFAISDGKEVVHSGRHGFPLDIKPEELTVELQKELDRFIVDGENAERNAEFAKADAQADETMSALIGKEITNKEEKSS